MESLNETDALRALAALAQSHRLRIHRALVQAEPHGMTPGDLAALLGMPGATLSFHLKELAAAGLVDAQREGRNLHYRVRLQRMDQLLDYLTENCCAGRSCEVALPGRAAIKC